MGGWLLKRVLSGPGIMVLVFAVTLVGVVGFFHAQGVKAARQMAAVTADRDSMGRWSDVTCALTGKVYRAPGMERKQWGVACQAEVQALAQFRKNTLEASNSAMAGHVEAQLKKASADLAAARRANEQTAKALKRMEAANAAVQEDRVSGDWFGALNELGGLRAPAP